MSYSELTKLNTKQRELLSHIHKSVDDYSIELSKEDVNAYAADIG